MRSKFASLKKSSGPVKWTKLSPIIAHHDEDGDDEEVLIDEDRETSIAPKRKKLGCCKRGPSLILALFFTFKGTLLAAGFFKFCQDSLLFVSPIILR